jgi:hypothetical protein
LVYQVFGPCGFSRFFHVFGIAEIQELYADPTKHFTDEELKERDANIKIGEEVGVGTCWKLWNSGKSADLKPYPIENAVSQECCCGRLGRAFPVSKSLDATQDLMRSSPAVPWCHGHVRFVQSYSLYVSTCLYMLIHT